MSLPTVFIGVQKIEPGEITHVFLIGEGNTVLDLPIHRDALAALLIGLQDAAHSLPAPAQTKAVPIRCTSINGVQSDIGYGVELQVQGLGSIYVVPDREGWSSLADASERALKSPP